MVKNTIKVVKMIRIFSVMFLAAAVLVSCGRGGNVVVTATIQGARNGTLYLQHEVDGLYRNVDSVEMKKNGRFELSADVDSPEVYYLAFGKSAPVISFFAEPGTVNVSARIDSLSSAKVTGGKNQELYTSFMEYMRDFASRKNDAYIKILQASAADGNKDSLQAYSNAYSGLERRQAQFIANFAVTNASYEIAPLIAYTFLNKGYSPILDTIKSKMPQNILASKYGREFSSFVEQAKNTLVGMKAPQFEMSQDSLSFSSEDYAGKYMFLVVWAAGDEVNSDYITSLKDVYAKWHGKGLEVLSSCISADDQQYGYDTYYLSMPWTEIRDARGVKNTVAEKFALTGNLPASVLIAPDGTILAKYITPSDLDKVLAYLQDKK